jgi:hypothetical protein
MAGSSAGYAQQLGRERFIISSLRTDDRFVQLASRCVARSLRLRDRRMANFVLSTPLIGDQHFIADAKRGEIDRLCDRRIADGIFSTSLIGDLVLHPTPADPCHRRALWPRDDRARSGQTPDHPLSLRARFSVECRRNLVAIRKVTRGDRPMEFKPVLFVQQDAEPEGLVCRLHTCESGPPPPAGRQNRCNKSDQARVLHKVLPVSHGGPLRQP